MTDAVGAIGATTGVVTDAVNTITTRSLDPDAVGAIDETGGAVTGAVNTITTRSLDSDAVGAIDETGGAVTGAVDTITTRSLDNSLDVLSPNGISLDAIVPDIEDVHLRGLSSEDVAKLKAKGIVDTDIELLEKSNGKILGIQTERGAFAIPGASIPAGLPHLPTLPAQVGNIISGLRR